MNSTETANRGRYEVWVADLDSLYDYEVGKPPNPATCGFRSDDLALAREDRDSMSDHRTASWIVDGTNSEIVQ